MQRAPKSPIFLFTLQIRFLKTDGKMFKNTRNNNNKLTLLSFLRIEKKGHIALCNIHGFFC